MTSRERLLAVLHGEVPDCVPCCPDISNMVPCRLTGKPFWEIYAHQDPPLWKAHIDALKHFDIDGGFEIYSFGPVDPVTGDSWMPGGRLDSRQLKLNQESIMKKIEDLDPNMITRSPDGDLAWYDLKKVRLEGQGWAEESAAYTRLPARAVA
jgi:hypothetical protein